MENNKSVESIINIIENIVKPYWKFNMDDIYGDRCGFQYPNIEELSVLYFKAINQNSSKHQTKLEQDQMIEKLNELNFGEIEIIKIPSVGKFIKIILPKYNEILISKYNKYKIFKDLNDDKINSIYEQLDKKVPKEFIGCSLFYNNNDN